MLTGSGYRASLRDGRRVVLHGRRIDDLEGERAFSRAIDWIARGYDRHHDARPGATNPLMEGPRTVERLHEQAALLRTVDPLTAITYQSMMTLHSVAPEVGRTHPDRAARITAYRDAALRDDVRITFCITDAKGDRVRRPGDQGDPDAYLRVVDRRSDGIVVRGAKLHITGGPLCHDLLVMPTKQMKQGEEDYAVACAVPIASEGVSVIASSYAPAAEDDRHFPYSRVLNMPDAMVVFDDVLVPWDRVFIDGQVEHSATFAHALGLWERLSGTNAMAWQADVLVGLAQLIAEANGLDRVPHVRLKISEMIIHATLVRAGLEAAIARAQSTPDGYLYPDDLRTNAAKFYGATHHEVLVRHLHDIAGGAVVTAPTLADLDDPEVGPWVRKYLATSAADGEHRLRLFHAIRDVTADAFGGWNAVTHVQSGGGLLAQQLVVRKHYDLDAAKALALGVAGMGEGHVRG